MEIEVVDSLMGNGKTHVTLRYIENEAIRNSKERWIYCTEYLDEIDKRTTENAEALHLWRTPAAEMSRLPGRIVRSLFVTCLGTATLYEISFFFMVDPLVIRVDSTPQ